MFGRFLTVLSEWGGRRTAWGNQGWHDVYVTSKPHKPDAIIGSRSWWPQPCSVPRRKTPPSRKRAGGGGDGGRWERGVEASKSWALFTASADESSRRLMQSDGLFSGEGAEPPNFCRDPSAGAAEKPKLGVAALIVAQRVGMGQGPHYNA